MARYYALDVAGLPDEEWRSECNGDSALAKA